jgi:hypothetical protein
MKWIKQPVRFYFAIHIVCVSCATLNVDEIRNLQKTAFDPVELIPGYETDKLRIDLVRNTFTENVNDSVTETKDTPYHPFGFDLGNGIFYDVNENLCLRLDFLLGFSEDENFEVHGLCRANPGRGINIYRFSNDTFKVNHMYGKNLHYRYHRVSDANGVTMMYKKRTKYSIAFTDTSAIYSENLSQPRIIQQMGKDQYDLNIRKRKNHFRKTGPDVFLDRFYIVSLAADRLSLEIKDPHKKKNNVLYTLVKSNHRVFVYNRRYSGIKLEMNKDSIVLFRNKTLWTKFELIH